MNGFRGAGSVLLVACIGSTAACSSGPDVAAYVPTAREEQMYAHFRDALEMRAGAVFGDLDRIQDAGSRLADAPFVVGMPAGSERFSRALRQAARAAADARTYDQARAAAADVARSCGSCHAAYRVGPDFVVGGPPPGESLRQHMARQTWVSRLLWDGLIGPTNEMWSQGAEELQASPPFPQEIAGRVQDSQVLEEARSRLHNLGARAAAATDPEERASILGEVWGVCSGCHGLAGQLGN